MQNSSDNLHQHNHQQRNLPAQQKVKYPCLTILALWWNLSIIYTRLRQLIMRQDGCWWVDGSSVVQTNKAKQVQILTIVKISKRYILVVLLNLSIPIRWARSILTISLICSSKCLSTTTQRSLRRLNLSLLSGNSPYMNWRPTRSTFCQYSLIHKMEL